MNTSNTPKAQSNWPIIITFIVVALTLNIDLYAGSAKVKTAAKTFLISK